MTDLISAIGPGELLAILSSFTFSAAQIFIRKGMRTATPLTAALIVNSIVSLGGLSISLYRGTLFSSTLTPILWFLAVGVAGPGIGRIAAYIGMTRMGLSRSVTISSSTPLWSTLIAITMLGETPSGWTVFGTFGIVFGVALLSMRVDDSQTFRSWLTGALMFPLIASVAYALPPIFAKMAYVHQQTPAVGMAIAFSTANILLLTAKPHVPIMGKISADRTGVLMLCAAGFLGVASSFALWTAIMISTVSTTIPLSRTAPFLVLILSYIFFGKQEPITRRMVIGTLFVVLGGVMVTAFR